MSEHLRQLINLPETASILQLNCRRSETTIQSLFNTELTNSFSILCLQEPHVSRLDYLPAHHQNWILISPQPASRQEADRPRACIYINKRLNATINPLISGSRDVAACTITINGVKVLLTNVYNQPSTFLGFDAMDSMLRKMPTSILLLPTIVVTDSNLHSPIWNPESYAVHDAAADALVEVMMKWDLYL